MSQNGKGDGPRDPGRRISDIEYQRRYAAVDWSKKEPPNPGPTLAYCEGCICIPGSTDENCMRHSDA